MARNLDSDLLLAVAYSGFFINLFNLIPLSPLDGGRIAAQGRHADLMKSSDLYRRMCARLSVVKSLDEPETVDELIEAAKRWPLKY